MAPEHHAAPLVDELGGCGCGAAGGQHIIDDQHRLTGPDSILVDLQLVGPVLELVVLADRLPRQLAWVAEGHEACPESQRDRAARDEPSGFDRRHHVGWALQPVAADLFDDALEDGFVRQQRGYVLEDDPRLWEIRDVADELPQGLVGDPGLSRHTTRRKYSRGRAKPSSTRTP